MLGTTLNHYLNSGQFFVLDTRSGRLSPLLKGTGQLANPRLAANDSQLYFLQGTNASDIWVVRFGDPSGTR
jgi:hypothetical protein